VKILVLSLLAVISLTSCNTSIGLWRDTKAGFQWSKQKIQQSGGGGGGGSQEYEYGAPVY
jgi:predicted small secreted protein